ncbi:hypothetical protein B0H10DRAFT_1963521 [Mycena sp. CBHHK59/15]|nr:hypothetical protein B0H10DRAFT_1963521 [Mycena sp. CBHHK59/15]
MILPGFTQQDVAALEQPVPVSDTLSIDMSSDSEPGDSSLSFSLISDLSSSLDSADSCHDWSDLLGSDWRLGESSSDSSTSSTGSSSDEDDNMLELHPAGYHDSDDDSSAGGSSSASDSGGDGVEVPLGTLIASASLSIMRVPVHFTTTITLARHVNARTITTRDRASFSLSHIKSIVGSASRPGPANSDIASEERAVDSTGNKSKVQWIARKRGPAAPP